MNRIQIIGRLGGPPQMSRSARGPVANFSVATNETWTNRETGQKQEHTEWHQAVCFDRYAEIIGRYLTKGDEIYIEGQQRTTQWTDASWNVQKGVQIRVEKFRMFARNPREGIEKAIRIMELVEDALRRKAAGEEVKESLTDLADMLDFGKWEFRGRPEE